MLSDIHGLYFSFKKSLDCSYYEFINFIFKEPTFLLQRTKIFYFLLPFIYFILLGFLNFHLKYFMYFCLCECHICIRGQRRVLDSLKLVCEPPDMSIGNRTQVLWKSSKHWMSEPSLQIQLKMFYGFLPPTFVGFNYFPSFLR